MTATDRHAHLAAAGLAPLELPVRSTRVAAPPRSVRCCCATSSCCARTCAEFIPRTILQPLLLVFVFTYVFPKIGQGVGGGHRCERSSPPCSSPA